MRDVRGAIRNVSAQDFASGRMGRSMPVSESMMRSASMMRGTLPVAHTQASMGNRAGNFSSNRSATANSEHFFSRSGATAAGRAGGNTEELWGAVELHGYRTHGNRSSRRGRLVLQLAAVFRPQAGRRQRQWREFGISGEKRHGPARESAQLAAVREPQPLQRADGIRTVHSARGLARLLASASYSG